MNTSDFYQNITNKIVALLNKVNLEDYEPPFARLAAQGLPLNPTTLNRYQGVNIPCLWFYQQERGFTSNQWATYRQWKNRDAQVRKGEQGNTIVFYKTLNVTNKNDQGEEETSHIPMLKLYKVFNANQVDGYEHEQSPPVNQINLVQRIKLVDEFCRNTGADIRYGGTRAYYNRRQDYINLPNTIDFVNTKDSSPTKNYYSTLLHELTHWTGSSQRLDRDKATTKSDQSKYAFEELVAELGAAFLCAQLGITQSPREDHALYIKSWLQVLKNDNRHIFKASSLAAQATKYLNALQPELI